MDFGEIKRRVLTLRGLMIDSGLRFDGAILFGSHAAGTARPDSDIDLAVISRDFGKDRYAEGALLNQMAFQCIPECDAIPIGVHEYLDPEPISPILHEIKKKGTPLF